MPKDGFKYGIRDNKEFAKLQQYLIDLSKIPIGIPKLGSADKKSLKF